MKKILLILFLSLFLPLRVFATSMFDVVINEIAWMGTENSASDEWMELKNNTSSPIDLSGWTLQTADEKIVIKLIGTIPANGFYLLERTDETTLPNIAAEQIYTGGLSNNGQDLWLYDTNNNIIDEADFYQGWEYGNNTTKQTMERIGNETWQTSESAGGTPKSGNSVAASGQAPQPKNSSEPQPSYPNGIFINEILPNPEGSDETDEWIELYNSNNFEVDLSGWKIKDTAGTVTTYDIPKSIFIPSSGFLVFKRPETKIMLNNDEDGLNLLNPNKEIVDSASYAKAPLGQSYNKASDSWHWSVTLTPGSANIIAATGSKDLPKTKKSDKNNIVEAGLPAQAGLADISQSIQNQDIKRTNPWFLFFTALAITIILASATLFIKFKFLKKQ